jgi:hypothetical protein
MGAFRDIAGEKRGEPGSPSRPWNHLVPGYSTELLAAQPRPILGNARVPSGAGDDRAPRAKVLERDFRTELPISGQLLAD